MKTQFLISFLLLLFTNLNGQFVEPKFGKIEMSDLTMTRYDKDTTAGALILFNIGKSKIIYNNDQFKYQYERHCRIKIFKNSAFDVSDIKIHLYKNKLRKEELKNLTAATFNLENGKIGKTQLDNKKVYRAEEDNYINVSFALPETKEGSVIEFSYIIISDFLYNFRGWIFQGKYPALWNQYSYEIPKYFQYRETSKGYLKFDVMEKTQNLLSYSIPKEVEVNRGGATYTTTRNDIIKVMGTNSNLAIKDVPAFIPEPNIDCEDNYIQSIEFELSSVDFPDEVPQNFAETWESVNTRMKDDPDFGMLLKSSGFVKDTVDVINNNNSKLIDKARGIYNYVQKKFRWDGTYHIFATKGLKKPYNDRVGSSSEINLLLTMMLQTAGLSANPVLFSTRDNGIAISYFPTISKYNSVLSMVNIDGKVYLLDATSKFCPFGLLPANDLNGKGRVVNNQTGDWVNLDPSESYKVNKNYTLEIDSDGKMTGRIAGSYDGYAGVILRNTINSEKTVDDYYRKLQEITKGLTINKFSVADRDNIYKPVTDSLNVEILDNSEIVGNKIMFSPLLFETTEKNRYTLEERTYPVNYNYPISEHFTFVYTIPQGYQVESLPNPGLMKMPDNSISVTFNIQKIENKIKVEYTYNIVKVVFLPDEYKTLKNLYDQIVKKSTEQVILKKSS